MTFIANGTTRNAVTHPAKREAEGIICLIDGKLVRDVARYIQKVYAMTADQYREMFNLPTDYKMSIFTLPTARATPKRTPDVYETFGVSRYIGR